jgi:hypothetical protein
LGVLEVILFVFLFCILIDCMYSFSMCIKRIIFRRGGVTHSTIFHNIVGACAHPLPTYGGLSYIHFTLYMEYSRMSIVGFFFHCRLYIVESSRFILGFFFHCRLYIVAHCMIVYIVGYQCRIFWKDYCRKTS